MSLTSLNEFESRHLLSSERVKLGSFYTPQKLVDTVHKLIANYKCPKAVVFDSSAGAGAFIKPDKIIYKAVEFDPIAGTFLKKKLPEKNLFIENAILNVSRKKYNIPPSAFLIQIGNPPYNDVTSAYRKGKKGRNISDADLFDRDLGISFLKSYNKLKADVVCVLHPLSYLIKRANFKRLGLFRQNYRLKKAFLFSSQMFKQVSSTPFPIMIGLYIRDCKGMSYNYIQNFKFLFLEEQSFFKLNQCQTVDCFIRKYPPIKTAPQVSDIGLYYWTFRDINSLFRNKGLHLKKGTHSIVVSLENLYQYAYLQAFKKLFQPKDLWLYGNLSPLGAEETVKKHKKLFVEYALLSENQLFSQLNSGVLKKIIKFYNLKALSKRANFQKIEHKAIKVIHSSLCPSLKNERDFSQSTIINY